MIDILGYNDRRIAHGPWAYELPRDMARRFAPGHMKHDLDFTLRERQPDVLFQWWPVWEEAERALLRQSGFVRHRTGELLSATAGEIWVKPPLTLDPAEWRRGERVRR